MTDRTDHPLRDQAAIVGIGYTEFSKASGVSTLTLALRAIAAAVGDAGLTVADVDGVACHRVGDSAPAALVAQSLGIQDLRFHYDLFGGGSVSAGVVAGGGDGRGHRPGRLRRVLAGHQRPVGPSDGGDRARRTGHARVPVPGPLRAR